MGKATRWLKALFGMKKKETSRQMEPSGSRLNIIHNPSTIPPNISPAWIGSFLNETEINEQNKHAIAVAAATAAAADVAVAAAQAAAEVVRAMCFGVGKERLAAVRIQTVYRGYLARKALRALKGLVKLQAHVRGYLVRKQAAATLHGLQALIRAQATILSKRGHNNLNNDARCEIGARKSMERFDETRSDHTASAHSRRLSASLDSSISNNSVEESPKIVEVDTLNGICRPKSRSRRTNVSSVSDLGSYFQILSSPFPLRGNFGQEAEWGSTAHNVAPATPKSVSGDSLFGQHGNNCPNYMANTQSFKAKLRSISAPKQRPEPGRTKKRISLNELMESRSSLSGVQMQRSCSQAQEAINFKNAVMGSPLRGRDGNRKLVLSRN